MSETDKMPLEIWAGFTRTNEKFWSTKTTALPKYHHDSVLQALKEENAELKAENESLKMQIYLLPNGKVYSRRELENRIEFLKKQLEGKNYEH